MFKPLLKASLHSLLSGLAVVLGWQAFQLAHRPHYSHGWLALVMGGILLSLVAAEVVVLIHLTYPEIMERLCPPHSCPQNSYWMLKRSRVKFWLAWPGVVGVTANLLLLRGSYITSGLFLLVSGVILVRGWKNLLESAHH